MRLLDAAAQDLRFALRSLRRNPGYAAAAILTLAIGLGANSVVFSLVNGVLVRPLDYPESEQLVAVWGHHPAIGRETASLPDFLDWQAGARSFRELAAVTRAGFTLTGTGEPELVRGALATVNFFRTLGVTPALGRDFRPDETTRAAPRVAILGDGFWRRRFGGRADAIGRAISLGGEPYTVVGVAPAGLRWQGDVDLWAPLVTDTARGRRSDFLTVVGRLRPGVTLPDAATELGTVARRLAERYPETNARWGVELVPLREEVVGEARPALLVFMGAVGLVLLIACANVANLTLARAAARGREVTIRAALGASRARLLGQVLAESVVVALVGGAVGLAAAVWGLEVLRRSAAVALPRLSEVGVDPRALGFTLGLALLTGIGCGLVPALRFARSSLQGELKEGSGGAVGGAGVRSLRGALVVAEVAIACVLLVGAGLLLRSFERLLRVDPGFRPDGVLTARVSLPRMKYADEARQVAFFRELREQVAAAPGVRSAGLVSAAPLSEGAPVLAFSIREVPDPAPGQVQDAEAFTADAGYFRTLGIPLMAGRLFAHTDLAASPAVAIVNQAMARRFWPGRSPLGSRITFGDPADSGTVWRTVIGIVGDIRHASLAREPAPQVYLPVTQQAGRSLVIAVRAVDDPSALAGALRAVVSRLDPDVPMSDVSTMHERLAGSVTRPRASAVVLGLFAAVALLLAAIGIYGVIAFGVVQRTRELGVRVALGAQPRAVLTLVIRQGMTPVLAGIALGLAGAWGVTRLMRGLLFGVSATDPTTFAAVALFLAAVALTATYLPARRAAGLDPVAALRSE